MDITPIFSGMKSTSGENDDRSCYKHEPMGNFAWDKKGSNEWPFLVRSLSEAGRFPFSLVQLTDEEIRVVGRDQRNKEGKTFFLSLFLGQSYEVHTKNQKKYCKTRNECQILIFYIYPKNFK